MVVVIVSPLGLAKNPRDMVSLSLLVNVESFEFSTILNEELVLPSELLPLHLFLANPLELDLYLWVLLMLDLSTEEPSLDDSFI